MYTTIVGLVLPAAPLSVYGNVEIAGVASVVRVLDCSVS